MLLMLKLRPERDGDVIGAQVIETDRDVALTDGLDPFGNRRTRVLLPAGLTTLSADVEVVDSGEPDPVLPDLAQHAVQDLPDEALPFLLSSRYCEVDLLNDLAWALFGATPPGWARVQAIVDYAHARIAFDYAQASPRRTAAAANVEQVGVCRDYAHLAVTLCRCMNIPARYCTGYLGDVGVPYDPAPMDFSAWFEVYLGGGWRTFDARHNRPRIGRLMQAYGRDAADVAISTAFGAVTLARFEVICEPAI
jgi:transglutaminase-like putative cysteine protease